MSIPTLAAAAVEAVAPASHCDPRDLNAANLARRIIAWNRLDAAVRAMVEANTQIVAIGGTSDTIADAERRGRLAALSDVARMMVHLEQQVTA